MDKIICVGKNYLKHAQELGDAVPESPIIFIKPPSTLLEIKGPEGEADWPQQRGDLHHELELVFKLGHHGNTWGFTHYTFGLDMTLREAQAALKKQGHPWERAKAFPHAAVIGPWREINSLDLIMDVPFSLTINGQLKQQGKGRDMRFKPQDILKDLATWCPLKDGDALFTGTPEGVGPVHDGDILEIRGGDVHYKVKCRRK